MKFVSTAVAVLLFFAFAIPAFAGDSSVSSNGTWYLEYSNDVLSKTEKMEGEIEWTLRGDWFTMSGRVGNDWPFPFQKEEPKFQKRWLKLNFNDSDMTLGNFSAVLGRGIVLNAKEDRPLGYDSMLDGLLFNFDQGKWDNMFFYGYHKTRSNTEFPIGVNTTGDADKLWGSNIGYDFGDVEVDTYYLNSYIGGTQEEVRKDAFMGFNIELDVEDWRLLYEHDFRDTYQGFNDGRANYAELSGGWPGLGVVLQYKDFWNMLYPYASPPRLRRGDLEESSTHPQDEKGYMATLIYRPEFLGESYMTGILAASQDSKRLFPFHEMYIEYQHDPLLDTTFNLGFDYVKGNLQANNYLPAQYRDYILGVDHAMGDNSAHVHARFTDISGTSNDEEEKELGIDFNYGEDLTLSLFYEASTKEYEPASLAAEGPPSKSPGKWLAFSFVYDIDPDTALSFLWGSKRGGIDCSGGVCVQKPPFKGLQITLRKYF